MRPLRFPIATLIFGVMTIAIVPVGCSRKSGNPAVEQSTSNVESVGPNDEVTRSNSAPAPVSVAYVGSQSCVKCHQQRHESYLKSHHSRSLTKVDVDAEVTDQRLDHPPSGRSYQMIRRDGKLWHRETILEGDESGDAEDQLVISEFPIEYVMGSGKFAKGYLVSEDKFLLQSPVTWYAGNQAYGMSPGYDSPVNAGFGRSVTDECLFCHSGMVSQQGENRYFFHIEELSIGCERCHGPGREHVEHYERLAAGGTLDQREPFRDSIVDPSRLSRLQSESLCGQCHCQGEAEVSVPGKRDWDFRPGEDFATVKMNFDAVVDEKDEARFVGHFPQLHASKCYQGSTTMTCVTCHSPHHHPEGDQRHVLQRQQCLECHQDESCGLPNDVRMQRNENRCVECHMPKTKSEVPHTSTTNHRIAIYRDTETVGDSASRPSPSRGPIATPKVVALQEFPADMSPSVAERIRALGTYWLYRKHAGDPAMSELSQMAGQAMQGAVQAGNGDAEVFANLAMLTYMQIGAVPAGPNREATVANLWEWAMGFAQEALRRESKPSESRETALEVTGRYFYRLSQHQQSAAVFSELTQIRRRKEDWAMLGISLAQLGDLRGSEAALRESIRINGGDADLYETLAIVIGGNRPDEARELNAIARRVRQSKEQATEFP